MQLNDIRNKRFLPSISIILPAIIELNAKNGPIKKFLSPIYDGCFNGSLQSFAAILLSFTFLALWAIPNRATER